MDRNFRSFAGFQPLPESLSRQNISKFVIRES